MNANQHQLLFLYLTFTCAAIIIHNVINDIIFHLQRLAIDSVCCPKRKNWKTPNWLGASHNFDGVYTLVKVMYFEEAKATKRACIHVWHSVFLCANESFVHDVTCVVVYSMNIGWEWCAQHAVFQSKMQVKPLRHQEKRFQQDLAGLPCPFYTFASTVKSTSTRTHVYSLCIPSSP